MNDFGVNITGFTGVVKPRSFVLPKNPTTKQRTFRIVSGIGCSPEAGTRRTIKGTWLSDGAPDTISSYDFEYVINPMGKHVARLPEEQNDVEPVKLVSEVPVATKPIKRKRG